MKPSSVFDKYYNKEDEEEEPEEENNEEDDPNKTKKIKKAKYKFIFNWVCKDGI